MEPMNSLLSSSARVRIATPRIVVCHSPASLEDPASLKVEPGRGRLPGAAPKLTLNRAPVPENELFHCGPCIVDGRYGLVARALSKSRTPTYTPVATRRDNSISLRCN